MRSMRVVFTMAAVMAIAFTAAAQTQDAWIGTWKLNVAKSKYSPGPAPKSQTIKNEASAGGMMATTDGVDAQGKPTHTMIMTKFDGKEVPVQGAADAKTTRIYKRIDSHSYEFVTKVGGKVTTTAKSVVSADGKTRTTTTTGKNAQGQTVNNVAVYDKQ